MNVRSETLNENPAGAGLGFLSMLLRFGQTWNVWPDLECHVKVLAATERPDTEAFAYSTLNKLDLAPTSRRARCAKCGGQARRRAAEFERDVDSLTRSASPHRKRTHEAIS